MKMKGKTCVIDLLYDHDLQKPSLNFFEPFLASVFHAHCRKDRNIIYLVCKHAVENIMFQMRKPLKQLHFSSVEFLLHESHKTFIWFVSIHHFLSNISPLYTYIRYGHIRRSSSFLHVKNLAAMPKRIMYKRNCGRFGELKTFMWF